MSAAATPAGDARAARDVYFEFTIVGAYMKAAAIDSVTGIEVSVLGPARAPQSELQRLALQKLMAQLARAP